MPGPRFSWYLMAVVMPLSCANRDRSKEVPEVKHTYVKPPSSFPDTVWFDAPSVVYYFPDSLQLAKAQAASDPGAFSSQLHEYEYLFKNAGESVRQFSLNYSLDTHAVRNARFLGFRSPAGDSCIDLDLRGDLFGIFLFKPGVHPRQVDLANISSELPAYFRGYPSPESSRPKN